MLTFSLFAHCFYFPSMYRYMGICSLVVEGVGGSAHLYLLCFVLTMRCVWACAHL